jgi:hypothetical protein
MKPLDIHAGLRIANLLEAAAGARQDGRFLVGEVDLIHGLRARLGRAD